MRFVSFEPLLGRLPFAMSLRGVDWVIIGKLTGSRKVELKTAWVEDIIAECDREGIPVFMKNNLVPFFGKDELRQEFPKMEVSEHRSRVACRAGTKPSTTTRQNRGG